MGEHKQKPAASEVVKIEISNRATVTALEILRGLGEAKPGRAAQRELASAIAAIDFTDAQRNEMEDLDDGVRRNNALEPPRGEDALLEFQDKMKAHRKKVRDWQKNTRVLTLSVGLIRGLFEHLTSPTLRGNRSDIHPVEALNDFLDELEDAKNGTKKPSTVVPPNGEEPSRPEQP